MRIYVDTASLAEIEEWNEHEWVGGFTTNPTLMKTEATDGWEWAKKAVALTDKPISIDGPERVWDLGRNVYRKVTAVPEQRSMGYPVNHTAICETRQLHSRHRYEPGDIVSVFAGRIMDTGRHPADVIKAAKGTGALVLWASVREPFNITQAREAGCDIVTVTPAILRKYDEWQGLPLHLVAERTIAQFEADREGLW